MRRYKKIVKKTYIILEKYYKDLLKSLDLPDIHFHQLRNTYATILLKNSFNSKGVSHLLGHAKEIISVDVYGDTQEIIEDCLDVLEPFIEEVIPKERKNQYYEMCIRDRLVSVKNGSDTGRKGTPLGVHKGRICNTALRIHCLLYTSYGAADPGRLSIASG